MNKKLMKLAFVAVIALVGGINVFNAHKKEVLSDIVLANVEALADAECEFVLSGPMEYHITYLWICSWRCTPGGMWQCPM